MISCKIYLNFNLKNENLVLVKFVDNLKHLREYQVLLPGTLRLFPFVNIVISIYISLIWGNLEKNLPVSCLESALVTRLHHAIQSNVQEIVHLKSHALFKKIRWNTILLKRQHIFIKFSSFFTLPVIDGFMGAAKRSWYLSPFKVSSRNSGPTIFSFRITS